MGADGESLESLAPLPREPLASFAPLLAPLAPLSAPFAPSPLAPFGPSLAPPLAPLGPPALAGPSDLPDEPLVELPGPPDLEPFRPPLASLELAADDLVPVGLTVTTRLMVTAAMPLDRSALDLVMLLIQAMPQTRAPLLPRFRRWTLDRFGVRPGLTMARAENGMIMAWPLMLRAMCRMCRTALLLPPLMST